MQKFLLTKKAVHWTFTIVTVLQVLSGFGILNYQIMGTITFGLLTKTNAFIFHSSLAAIFVMLLILHLYLTVVHTKIFRKKSD